METAAKKLEILFSEAEQQLNVLSTKVDAQCRLLDHNASSSTLNSSTDTLSKTSSVTCMVGCVKDLRAELHSVAEDVATLQQQQQQVMQSIQCELLKLSQNLSGVAPEHMCPVLPPTSC
ncbi:hypothetical protein FHG87_021536 [Trinorchestia longiramus]|nr:hypothetical protein FHG87_021536 [Trinorchestia longiramus]